MQAKYTGNRLAGALKMNWRSLYKFLNDSGYAYTSEDIIPLEVIGDILKKYAQHHHHRPVEVSNAARKLAKELKIELDDYSMITEEKAQAATPEKKEKPRRPSFRKPRPVNDKPKVVTDTKDTQAIPGPTKSMWQQISIYLVLLYLSALVFVAFDGFSAAFIVLKTYVDIGENTDQLLAAVMEIKTNPILLYGTIVGALAGIFIGFIAIGSIVNFKGDEDYKNALKGAFAVYQFVLHFMAMPQKDAGMIVFSLGLTIGTFGCTIAIDNKLNSK